MNHLTDFELKQLNEAFENSSNGFWEFTCDTKLRAIINCIRNDRYETQVCLMTSKSDDADDYNAKFIQLIHHYYPKLISELIELREKVSKLETVSGSIKNIFSKIF